MSLNGAAIALIVPPTNFLVPCLAGLLAVHRFKRTGRNLLAIGILGMLISGMPIVSNLLILSLEQGLPLTPNADDLPGAIVVLSGDTARNEGTLGVGELTLERERAGAALYRRTHLPILVTGGVLKGSNQTLGALMAQSLTDDFQVPVQWVERQAQDTVENAQFSARLLKNNDVRSIYVVTHAWHMKRSLLAFRSTGLTVTAAPVRMDSPVSWKIDEFIPRAGAWLQSYYAFHEWIGYLVARLFYQ